MHVSTSTTVGAAAGPDATYNQTPPHPALNSDSPVPSGSRGTESVGAKRRVENTPADRIRPAHRCKSSSTRRLHRCSPTPKKSNQQISKMVRIVSPPCQRLDITSPP